LMHRAGKALLEKGQLRKRATFLPLNKIQGKSIPRDVVARAQELAGKENAVPAIELVEYAPELQAVCVCSPGYWWGMLGKPDVGGSSVGPAGDDVCFRQHVRVQGCCHRQDCTCSHCSSAYAR